MRSEHMTSIFHPLLRLDERVGPGLRLLPAAVSSEKCLAGPRGEAYGIYATPEIFVLGNAIRAINDSVSTKNIQLVLENARVKRQTAAYDLDE
jgi:hypothetical protein